MCFCFCTVRTTAGHLKIVYQYGLASPVHVTISQDFFWHLINPNFIQEVSKYITNKYFKGSIATNSSLKLEMVSEQHKYEFLTPEQVDHFMTHGFVVIKQAFTPEASAEFTKDVWIRLGMNPGDRSTWNLEVGDRIHMARHKTVLAKEFAPKAWGAICDLVGGEDKIDPATHYWSDEFIVNIGKEEYAGMSSDIDPKNLDNWHADGDFFVHHLDSPEQALLVIPLFSDIQHRGGATYISPDGLEHVARYLAAHPEGSYPTGLSFTPSTHPEQRYCFLELARTQLTQFVELTGNMGDVILLHPLMLHSASKNYIRAHRIITNPPVSLKPDQPFQFSRDDASEYSLVEKKTLRALGVDRWDRQEPVINRKRLVPKRIEKQGILFGLEKKRLEEYYAKDKGDSIVVPSQA